MKLVTERIKRREFPLNTKSGKQPEILDKVSKWKYQSESLKSTYEDRWSKNLKLISGIWSDEKASKSRVRQTNKIYFRKIWASNWRLAASIHSALMQDPDGVKVVGRDKFNDWQKAGVLQEMLEYRRDRMYNEKDLYIQHIWAFLNILTYGFTVAKMWWEDDPDGPGYKVWPPEQVYPDMAAELPHEMRYIIFESYLTKGELEDLGYDNIDKCKPETAPYSDLRAVRHYNHKDPQSFFENEYPKPGTTLGDGVQERPAERYVIWETYYKEDGKTMYCVTNKEEVVLQKEKESPYGDDFPIVMGMCLTVPHRLIGEGFPEPLEGPQESFNYNLNIRKDNVALVLNAPTLVSRFANADLPSLVNARAGQVVLADEITGIQKMEMGDVTQSSYAEASADELMMQEMSGVTAEKMGMSRADKATVAQINFQEGNEKINVFLSIVCETYWKRFHSLLLRMIAKFETDKEVFRIANQGFQMKEEIPVMAEIEDVDDFDADLIVYAGPTAAGRSMEIQNTMLLMDRAVMYNQQLMGLLQVGVIKPQDVKFLNSMALMEDILPKLGKRGEKRYFLQAQPPAVMEGQDTGGAEGRNTPQIGATDINAEANPFDIKMQGTPNMPA